MTEQIERQQTFTHSPALIALETKIRTHLSYAYDQIVEVGRCLNDAKEQKLVPRGQWENWLNEVAGMNERQAQRWMQIAREVPSGSALSQLGYTQIRQILTLPEPEREAVAVKARDESLTVKELEKTIAELKRQRSEEAAEAEGLRAQIENMRDFASGQMDTIKELKEQIKAAESKAGSEGMKARAQSEIANLKRQLSEAQELANIQSEKRREAQRELIELKKQQAENGGETYRGFDIETLMGAVREFVGRAGELPHMGAELSGLNDKRRREYARCVQMVKDWVAASEKALGTYAIEG